MVTLKFKCGCWLSFWSNIQAKDDADHVRSALACCKEHDAPGRRIKDILPLELEDIEWGR